MRDSDKQSEGCIDQNHSQGDTTRRGWLKAIGAASTAAGFGAVGTATANEGKVNVREHGAVGDGETDDREAIHLAANEAAPDGTVFFPSTEDSYLIGTEDATEYGRLGIHWERLGFPSDEKWDDLTFEGANYETTEIKMAGGQDRFHFGFLIDNEEPITGVTIKQLTINGNGANQDLCRANGILSGREATVENLEIVDCHFTGWEGAVIKPHEHNQNLTVSHCRFTDTGAGSCGGDQFGGHCVGIESPGTVDIEYTHFQRTHGTDVDISTGRSTDLTIHRCIGEGLGQFSGLLKVNPGDSTATVTNTLCRNRDSIPIKSNPKAEHIGTVRLEDVLVETVNWPGFDFPCPGRIELENYAAKNVDQDDNRGAGVYTGNRGWPGEEGETYGMEWDGGTISVHNVGDDDDGVAIKNIDASGTLDKLIYGGAQKPDADDLDGLDIGTIEQGEPLQPDVPTVDEVGPRHGSRRRGQ